VTASLHTQTSGHGTETLRHHAVQAFHRAETLFQHTGTSFHRAEKSFLYAAKSSGGTTLAQKQAKNGQNRVFCRSNRNQ
jgi:hypothetical protein